MGYRPVEAQHPSAEGVSVEQFGGSRPQLTLEGDPVPSCAFCPDEVCVNGPNNTSISSAGMPTPVSSISNLSRDLMVLTTLDTQGNPALLREFHRIAEEVHQDLAELLLVSRDILRPLPQIEDEIQSLLFRQQTENIFNPGQQTMEVEHALGQY